MGKTAGIFVPLSWETPDWKVMALRTQPAVSLKMFSRFCFQVLDVKHTI